MEAHQRPQRWGTPHVPGKAVCQIPRGSKRPAQGSKWSHPACCYEISWHREHSSQRPMERSHQKGSRASEGIQTCPWSPWKQGEDGASRARSAPPPPTLYPALWPPGTLGKALPMPLCRTARRTCTRGGKETAKRKARALGHRHSSGEAGRLSQAEPRTAGGRRHPEGPGLEEPRCMEHGG